MMWWVKLLERGYGLRLLDGEVGLAKGNGSLERDTLTEAGAVRSILT